jgi:hypothetical protein
VKDEDAAFAERLRKKHPKYFETDTSTPVARIKGPLMALAISVAVYTKDESLIDQYTKTVIKQGGKDIQNFLNWNNPEKKQKTKEERWNRNAGRSSGLSKYLTNLFNSVDEAALSEALDGCMNGIFVHSYGRLKPNELGVLQYLLFEIKGFILERQVHQLDVSDPKEEDEEDGVP